ncbi:hypothetical protein AVEN_13555-1 [Araneus ventricosus]|uniref:Uncharacterized protein n=1 Tax=Araneus ventricosus TaxID=182803 RepID=A0A4Y2D5E3_ARAVE|nr:hypothetical protein AVEN_13555-1 [Araneus ventricosus]
MPKTIISEKFDLEGFNVCIRPTCRSFGGIGSRTWNPLVSNPRPYHQATEAGILAGYEFLTSLSLSFSFRADSIYIQQSNVRPYNFLINQNETEIYSGVATGG